MQPSDYQRGFPIVSTQELGPPLISLTGHSTEYLGIEKNMKTISARIAAFLAGVVAVLWVNPSPGEKKSDQVVLAAAALYDEIRSETLPNGLLFYLKPVPGSAIVTTMVAYKVGSADEDKDHTGLSHYLEHLMF